MSGRDRFEACATEGGDAAAALEQPLGMAPAGPVVGEILALMDNGAVALVLYPGQPGAAALAARTVVDLHAQHIGRAAVLAFEGGDARRPIVMGVLRGDAELPLEPVAGHLEVEADGARLVLAAREQLVLSCGKARITLTRAGKVLIEGTYLLSRSTGMNRIRGGAIELN